MANQTTSPVMDFNTKQRKRKKIIIRSIVATSCAVILGVGVGGIAIGLNRPYSAIDESKTTMTIPPDFPHTINTNESFTWPDVDVLRLQVSFINHHQPADKKYSIMNNESFLTDLSKDYSVWSLSVDNEHGQYLQGLSINSINGQMTWSPPTNPPSADTFKLYVSVELVIHGFTNHYFMKSEPILMTLEAGSN